MTPIYADVGSRSLFRRSQDSPCYKNKIASPALCLYISVLMLATLLSLPQKPMHAVYAPPPMSPAYHLDDEDDAMSVSSSSISLFSGSFVRFAPSAASSATTIDWSMRFRKCSMSCTCSTSAAFRPLHSRGRSHCTP